MRLHSVVRFCSLALSISVSLVLVACSPSRDGGGLQSKDMATEAPKPISLAISPASASVTLVNGAAAGVDFVATGHFADGHDEDVTSSVTWAIADSTLGSIAAGHYDPTRENAATPVTRGGTTQITASLGDTAASATVTLRYRVERVSADDGSTAPPDSAAQFMGATADASLAPTVLYPLDKTRLPSNLNLVELQWTATTAGQLFRVNLEHPLFSLDVYTNSPTGPNARYTLTGAEWAAFARTVQDESAALTVSALASGTPARVGTATALSIDLAKVPLQGGIYYWSNPGNAVFPYEPAVGVMRRDFGDPSATSAAYYTGATANAAISNSGHCVGCHTVSRDGKQALLSFNTSDGNDGNGHGFRGLIDVATKTFLMPYTETRMPFASFAPDGKRMVAVLQPQALSPAFSQLFIYDTSGGAGQGATLQTYPMTQDERATQPDWSADGKSIVYVKPTTETWPWSFQSGSIVVLTEDSTGKFGSPRILVASTGGQNNYYPSFSPDGKWVLFNRSSGDSYNNADAEVWVVATDGSSAPVRLVQANGGTTLTNSWPKWTPFVQTYGPAGETLYYFTLSSKRNYGWALGKDVRSQIWMSSFRPSSIATDAGSSAPFWLPFQDLATSNHNAQWVQTIIPTL